MSRKFIITISIIIGTLMALIAIVVTLYCSWLFAKRSEIQNLEQIAEQVVARANHAYNEAYDVLRKLQSLKARPCSEQHINEMRRMAYDSLSVAEIGYFENRQLECTSWGPVDEKIPIKPPDIVSPRGVELTLEVYPLISKDKPMMGLLYKNYNVLVEPARFTDVIIEPGIQIAIVLNNGKVVSTHNKPDVKILNAIVQKKYTSNKNIVFVLRKGNSIVVVIEPRSYILKRWYRELKVLLPFGILMMLVFIGIVVWMSRRRLSPLGELRAAVARKEFLVFYQPLMDLQTETCIGAEALIRWHHRDGTWKRPDLFIGLAEENHLIQPITDCVISIVSRDLKDLLINDDQFHISVNVSAEDFKSGRILDVVNKYLLEEGVNPKQVWLEATERGFMDIKGVRKTLDKASELGYPVVIDDFGTGYSSLSYLQGLALDAIKIDKSFVSSLGTSSATSHVVHHIISIAKTLNLKLVAEGVETQEQVDYLREQEVEYAQGWLYAKALPIDEFLKFYKAHKKHL